MRAVVINTGTELLLGDVLNTHLRFIAHEIFQFGLRVDEQRTVPDSPTLQETFAEIFPRAEIVFVTGGLGPTSDDITRELVSEFLNLHLLENSWVREAISRRLALRRIPATERIWRQALVPRGGQVLPNENGTAPGIYISANIDPTIPSPDLFLLLSERKQSVAIAESCTGGFLANEITNVPGASRVFVAGCVTYSNEEKIRTLDVSRESIEKFGAVSEQVATEMAEGVRERTGATYGIATTGIAGPSGGSAEKPVGTVLIALSSEDQPTRREKFFFPSDR